LGHLLFGVYPTSDALVSESPGLEFWFAVQEQGFTGRLFFNST